MNLDSQLLQDFNDKLHFRELAKYFVQSYNPRLQREVIILDAIWCYDYKRIEGIPIRYDAHDFVKHIASIMNDTKLNPGQTYADVAEKLANCQAIPLHRIDMIKWIGEWLTSYT